MMPETEDDWLLSPEERAAKQKEIDRRKDFLSALRAVLMTPEGYRLIYSMLIYCGLDRHVTPRSSGRSFYQRQIGDELLDAVQEVSLDTCMSMIRDMRLDRVKDTQNA